jgi:hypothetical protein
VFAEWLAASVQMQLANRCSAVVVPTPEHDRCAPTSRCAAGDAAERAPCANRTYQDPGNLRRTAPPPQRAKRAVDLTRQLSNLDEQVVDLLKAVIVDGQRPALRTVPRSIVHHTILSEEQIGELVQAYDAGDSIAELRTRFRIGKNSLYRHLHRAGITPNRK